jgi:hypothetical protein
MRIEELLVDPRRREHAAMPEADALTQSDALREAQLLDVRFDALRSSVWLLFDCRGALQIEMGNTAVIVAHGLRRFSWTGQPRGRLTAWTVVSSEPVARRGMWSFSLAFVPSARMELEADSAETRPAHAARHTRLAEDPRPISRTPQASRSECRMASG